MATTLYWFGSWVSGPGQAYLNPGAAHYWVLWGFEYGSAISVTAHSVVLVNELVERTLTVEDVRVEGDNTGRRLYFTVRNTGSNATPGYGMGFSFVTQ